MDGYLDTLWKKNQPIKIGLNHLNHWDRREKIKYFNQNLMQIIGENQDENDPIN